jgi:hypothetical protein
MIDLVEGKKPPWGLTYNFLTKELEILRNYLNKYLAQNWVRPYTSSAGT